MARAIAARRGLPSVDEGCTLLASIGLVTYRRALDTWLDGSGSTELGDVVTEEFEILQAQFSRIGDPHAPVAS
jgi:hypothetical protein